MNLNRRSFLSTLGIAAAGIAFRPHLNFLVPENILKYDGPPTLEWALADSIALLAAELPANQFRHVAHASRLGQCGATDQFGIMMKWDDNLMKRTKQEIREWYLKPAMIQMAQEIKFRKVSTCFRMEIPSRCEYAAQISAPKHGLDLRFVRAWDMGGIFTDEISGKEYTTPPAWIGRFDMLAA